MAWCRDDDEPYGVNTKFPWCYGDVIYAHFLLRDCPTPFAALADALAYTAFIEVFVTIIFIVVYHFLVVFFGPDEYMRNVVCCST